MLGEEPRASGVGSGLHGTNVEGLNHVSQIHRLKSQLPVPQNVTVFGDRVFKEVIKLCEVIRVGSDPT